MMESKKLDSLNIEGLGTYAGGEFDRVNISGKGTITGDLKCQTLDISGLSKIQGQVACENMRVSGCGKLEHNIVADDIEVSGTLKCLKCLDAKSLYISGMSTIKQCLKANKVNVSGMLTVDGEMTCEEVKIDGMLNCECFLNCERLEISCVGTSKLNEVGAAEIVVKASASKIPNIFGFLVPKVFRENKVIANVIEGDEITLENCQVKVVRGRNVRIGVNCQIETLEYSGEVQIHESSKIAQINQI